VTSDVDPLAEVRRSLLVEFAALPGEGDVLAWQRRLADAIIAAEAKPTGLDVGKLKRHRHLLRVIGDALVHTVLPSHTIRALSRHPGKPAALTAQGADFDFVFEVAKQVRTAGAVPIIADLTTLIGVGDVVGWGPGGIGVFECKNREMPHRVSTSGRVARQRERGQRIEEYLTASSVVQNDGQMWEAYTAELPEPRWALVRDALERCVASPDRLAATSLGPDDTLVAFAHDASLDQLPYYMPSAEHLAVPAMAMYSTLIDHSDHRVWSPSSYPLSGEFRWQLLEGALRLIRCVDLGQLAAEFTDAGRDVRLGPRLGADGYEVGLEVTGFDQVFFTHQLVEVCLWMPVAVSAMRDTLVEQARALIATAGDGFGFENAGGRG
jgi:hypothetical protein